MSFAIDLLYSLSIGTFSKSNYRTHKRQRSKQNGLMDQIDTQAMPTGPTDPNGEGASCYVEVKLPDGQRLRGSYTKQEGREPRN
jgi:hypothetical protein